MQYDPTTLVVENINYSYPFYYSLRRLPIKYINARCSIHILGKILYQ